MEFTDPNDKYVHKLVMDKLPTLKHGKAYLAKDLCEAYWGTNPNFHIVLGKSLRRLVNIGALPLREAGKTSSNHWQYELI